MLKTANVFWFLLGMVEYQLFTDYECFHWLRPVLWLTVALMINNNCVLSTLRQCLPQLLTINNIINNNNFLKSYLQLIRLKKTKNYSFKTLFTIPVDLKST